METSPLKISIVIPTRNGAPYLRYCIETCLASDDQNLEVIVSDNCSSDNTREVVASFSDNRLHYYNTGASLSMRQNYEFVLPKATGDYIVYIGDDDGVLKNGFVTLRRVLEKYRPDVVNWRHITYKWPNKPMNIDSILKFRSRDFFGPLYKKNPKEVLDGFLSAELTSYRDGAHIYHGAVSRRLVEKVCRKTGEYFMGQSPDVYTGFANLACAENFIWIRNPITIGGESPKSNGAASLTEKRTKEQSEIVQNFIDLARQDKVMPEIDLTLRCLTAHVYANLMRVNEGIMDNSAKINHAKWRERILAENDQFEASMQRRHKEILYPFFAKADPAFRPPLLPPEIVATTGITDGREDATQRSASRKKSASRPDLLTVADASRWIDVVTGKSYLPEALLPLAFFKQAAQALRIQKNILLQENKA